MTLTVTKPSSYRHRHFTLTFTGEVQTILCLEFGAGDTLYSGTLSGDIYQWKGHTLVNVIKAHSVRPPYHTHTRTHTHTHTHTHTRTQCPITYVNGFVSSVLATSHCVLLMAYVLHGCGLYMYVCVCSQGHCVAWQVSAMAVI